MDIYHAFFNLKSGTSDLEFVRHLEKFMNTLKTDKKIENWRLMRRKLGLGPKEFGEFHLMIEVLDLAQLDAAFKIVSIRSGEIEEKHWSVNHMIDQVTFALYRDFPDPQRISGDEKF